MCDSPQSLKLCTCSEQIDLTKDSHWILGEHRTYSKGPTFITGMIARPPDFKTRSERSTSKWYKNAQESLERLNWGPLLGLALRLEKILNRSNCFDFEVKLKRGTFLTLKFASPTGFDCIQFELKNKRWKAVGAWDDAPSRRAIDPVERRMRALGIKRDPPVEAPPYGPIEVVPQPVRARKSGN